MITLLVMLLALVWWLDVTHRRARVLPWRPGAGFSEPPDRDNERILAEIRALGAPALPALVHKGHVRDRAG